MLRGGFRRLSKSTNALRRMKSTVTVENPYAPSKYGLKSHLDVALFGTGAVTNTLAALFKQSDDVNIVLQSRHASHIVSGGVKLLHGNRHITVDKGDIKVVQDPRYLAGQHSPSIIVNGRQLGGNYDEIFDACTENTDFIICAQNGFSSQALYRACQSYVERFPERKDIIHKIAGIDMSMFVKMSATDDRTKTILQPGAKWVLGAFSLADGSGTGVEGEAEVDADTMKTVTNFTEWFKSLGPTDGTNVDQEVMCAPETVTGKLTKTSNNIGGNYAAAIVTRQVHLASQKMGKADMEGPLPYGVLHEDYDMQANLGHLLDDAELTQLSADIAVVRKLSLEAVSEFYDLNADHFSVVMTKDEVLEAAQLYWTEMDPQGKRIPSKHPPTHALAMFEGRPSEPLLEDIMAIYPAEDTHALRALKDYHERIERKIPLPASMMEDLGGGWLKSAEAQKTIENCKLGALDKIGCMSIVSYHFQKPEVPLPFMDSLNTMGEHAISYMDRVGQFKAFYEALETVNDDEKEPFINLTIGGVYRVTPPRMDAPLAHRSYVTHITEEQMKIVADIMKSLGVDVSADQVGVSPMRSKLALQHVLGLFRPGVVVAHTPSYRSTIDSAVIDHGHQVVSVDIRGRYQCLFDETRRQASLPQNRHRPVILLLLDPHNPSAIGMTVEEEEALHSLINDCPSVSVVHDNAYQGYHKGQRDYTKAWRDEGMPHPEQVYIGVMSTSKSVYGSGQPAIYMADKKTMPFLEDHYRRMGTGPTSTFVHDLQYYHDTLDPTYMPSVEDRLQRPLMAFIDEHKERWGVEYLIRPDGPPFISLDVSVKLKRLGLTNKGYREMSLRMGSPVLIDKGNLRISLTGFDKSVHDEVLPHIKMKIDNLLSIEPGNELLETFKAANPFYDTAASS